MNYFSAFSGIGGFELGIQKVLPDAKCIGYSEIDKFAIKTYQAHFPDHQNYGDIKNWREWKLGKFDLLVGGFPCQKYSVAGLQTGDDLILHLLDFIEVYLPKYILLENVLGFLSKKFKAHRDEIVRRLEEAGYTVHFEVVNLLDCGLSQNRKRVLIWCEHGFNSLQKRYIKLKKTNSNNDDFANILSNAKRVPISDNLHYSLYSNRVDKTKLTTNTIPYAKSLGHPLMFERMHGYSKPTTYIYYAPTQRTKQDCNLFIVRPDGEITHPTPEVMEELQGFPIGYTEIAGVSKTQRIKQVGNAISPVMVQHFISNLI